MVSQNILAKQTDINTMIYILTASSFKNGISNELCKDCLSLIMTRKPDIFIHLPTYSNTKKGCKSLQ